MSGEGTDAGPAAAEKAAAADAASEVSSLDALSSMGLDDDSAGGGLAVPAGKSFVLHADAKFSILAVERMSECLLL